jgi:predicted GNAT superfamily acetyltransferase
MGGASFHAVVGASTSAGGITAAMRAPGYTPAMRLRDLETVADLEAVVRLQREVWGDRDDIVPLWMLAVVGRTGGILIGAEDDAGAIVAFVLSVPGIRYGRTAQWSHLLAVAPAARGQGLGVRLKLAQRQRALDRGHDLIEWTFDPLMAGNAHLNVRRLGAIVEHYLENVYGASASPLHHGAPTDRFIATWNIASPHVARRIGAGALVARDAGVAHAPAVLPTGVDGTFRVPLGEPDLSRDEPRLRVEIPADYARMLGEAPDLAVAWRHAARRVFQAYFGRGYRVVDVDAGADVARPSYLLALKA